MFNDREEDRPALLARIDRPATMSSYREEDDPALSGRIDRRATVSTDSEEDLPALLPSRVRRETKPSDKEEDGPALSGRIDRRATVSTDGVEDFPERHQLPIPPCGTCNRRRAQKFPVYTRSGLVICDGCLMNAKKLYSSSGVDNLIQKWTQGFWYDLGNVLRPDRPTLRGYFPILNTTQLDFGPENGEFRMALTKVPEGKFEISFRIETSACLQNASAVEKLTAKFGGLGAIAFMVGPIKDYDAYLNKGEGNPSWDWKAYRKRHTIKDDPSGSSSAIVKLSRNYQVTAGQAVGIFVQYSWANSEFSKKCWSLHQIRLVEPCISLVIYYIILEVNSMLI